MEFEPSDYSVQQVRTRSRQTKIDEKDREKLEKQRLAARHEHYERNVIVGNIIKPQDKTDLTIDDVDRFNRDYTAEQRHYKEETLQLTLARAQHRKVQQQEYEKSIQLRREEEAREETKRADLSAAHDFNVESVLYNPVTNISPETGTMKETQLTKLDTKKEEKRDARSRRIYHLANSTGFDPITGEKRKAW